MFPPLPVKFRTAGFPQYSFKASMSGGAVPSTASSSRRAVCIRPSCASLPASSPRSKSRGAARYVHHRSSGQCRFTPGTLAPVRVMLSRSIITYLVPCAPLGGTARFHRTAAYTRCLRCAPISAPRRPTSGSVLSLAYFLDMSSSGTDGKFIRLPIPSSFTDDAGLRPEGKRSRHFQLPHPPILVGGSLFRGFTTVHFRCDLPICLLSCRS